jgi:hypothetical protein
MNGDDWFSVTGDLNGIGTIQMPKNSNVNVAHSAVIASGRPHILLLSPDESHQLDEESWAILPEWCMQFGFTRAGGIEVYRQVESDGDFVEDLQIEFAAANDSRGFIMIENVDGIGSQVDYRFVAHPRDDAPVLLLAPRDSWEPRQGSGVFRDCPMCPVSR